jgi:hypothetical protein
MGEFEFALVFFEKGLAIRKDIVAFRDGIAKSRHAILHSINGEAPFLPNPNFATSRPRKALTVFERKTPLEEPEGEEGPTVADLLPEKVPPLALTKEEKSRFLGEIALDYDYLVELREELLARPEDSYGHEEDVVILKIVTDALIYLSQRAQFWNQQGGKDGRRSPSPSSKRPTSARNVPRMAKEAARRPKTGRPGTAQVPHYEMSKIQIYEQKLHSRKA